MPKDQSDFRVARAALSAPYPLPIIITRAHIDRVPTPHPDALLSSDDPGCSQIGDDRDEIVYVDGFPYNPRWRERPPAIEPIPYPPADPAEKERRKARRKWKIMLRRQRRMRRGDHREEEGESLMSGIEEGPSDEGAQITRIGSLGFETHPSQNQTQTPNIGLLHAPIEADINREFFETTPVQPEIAFGRFGALDAPAHIVPLTATSSSGYSFLNAQTGQSSQQISEYLRDNISFTTRASAGSGLSLNDCSPESYPLITPEDSFRNRRAQSHHPQGPSPLSRALQYSTPTRVPSAACDSDADSAWSCNREAHQITYRIPRSKGAKHKARAEEQERLRKLYRPASPSSDETITPRKYKNNKGKAKETHASLTSSSLQPAMKDSPFCSLSAGDVHRKPTCRGSTAPPPLRLSGTPAPSLPLDLERLIDIAPVPLSPAQRSANAQAWQQMTSSPSGDYIPAGPSIGTQAIVDCSGNDGNAHPPGFDVLGFGTPGIMHHKYVEPSTQSPRYNTDASEDPPWTPMIVDPRSGDLRQASWPHPVHSGPVVQYGNIGTTQALCTPEVGSFGSMVFEGQHRGSGEHSLIDYGRPPGLILPRRLPSSAQSCLPLPLTPLRGTTRGLLLPSAPPTRPSPLPPAKACHNFLLARRVNGKRRADQLREWTGNVKELSRAATPLDIGRLSPHTRDSGNANRLPQNQELSITRAETEPPILQPSAVDDINVWRSPTVVQPNSQTPKSRFVGEHRTDYLPSEVSRLPTTDVHPPVNQALHLEPFSREAYNNGLGHSDHGVLAPAPMPLTHTRWLETYSSPRQGEVPETHPMSSHLRQQLSGFNQRNIVPDLPTSAWEANNVQSPDSRKRRRGKHHDQGSYEHISLHERPKQGEQDDVGTDGSDWSDLEVDPIDVDTDIDGQSIFSSIELSYQNGIDQTAYTSKRRRGEYSLHEMSAFKLLLGHSGYIGRELKEEEKEARRREWLREDKARAMEQNRMAKVMRDRVEKSKRKRSRGA